MTHPLADLDGKRKYVFSKGGEDFFLKVVTSKKEVAKDIYRKPISSMESITLDSEEQLAQKIKKDGRVIKNPTPKPAPGILEREVNEYPNNFETPANCTLFVLENEKGEFVSTILITINDLEKREALKVPTKVGTFIYVSDIATSENYRGKNLFSGAFDKMMTMLANPASNLQLPIEYSVSMTATTTAEKSGAEFNYVKNLPIYADMWQKRFTENELQNRHQFPMKMPSGNFRNMQIGLERMPLGEFLDEANRIDEEKVDGLIQGQKEKLAGTGVRARGLYLEGASPEYGEVKEKRAGLLQDRQGKGIEKDPEKKTKWIPGVEVGEPSAGAVSQAEYSRKK